MKRNGLKLFTSLPMLLALIALAGCATNVVVSANYPNALTKRLPLNAGLVFDNEFTNYTFTNVKGRDVSVALGESQTKLFSSVIADMFQTTALLDKVPSPDESPDSDTGNEQPQLDMIIVPHVEQIQLAMPFETKLTVFEVWIKYNIQVFASDGQPIADWIMTSYGKTQTRFMKSDEEALNQATVVALRDAGARLVTGFHKVPDVRDWLEHNLHKANTAPAEVDS